MLNLKSIKVTNGENINNLPIQVSTKGIWGGGRAGLRNWRVAPHTVWEICVYYLMGASKWLSMIPSV